MNPLEEYPVLRKWVYKTFWMVGITIGAIQVALMSLGRGNPDWLVAAVAVLGYLSIATNYTADRNVTVGGEPIAADGKVEGRINP